MFRLVLASCLASVALGSDAEGTAYLDTNKNAEGVTTLASGLQYKVLRQGDGAFHPKVGTSCECHYEGKLLDGSVFDSSYARGSPTSFAPNQVIKGWTEAMQLMVEGDQWELTIPSEMAYGASGSPPKIPGDSVLIFKIEIIKINGDKVEASRCDPETKDGCSEKETKFIDVVAKKFKGDAAKITGEADRLKKMGSGKMKPELKQWIDKRITILTKLVSPKKEEKEEL
jgi:FKBP-type peptidyl-prolyl cis-trans isomerase FklB